MAKTVSEINEKIRAGKAVIMTAEEIIGLVKEKGVAETAKTVDVVTTGTFGPMCSSGAFLNFGHSTPAIRMNKVWLNGVPAYAGVAAVDAYIGATKVGTLVADISGAESDIAAALQYIGDVGVEYKVFTSKLIWNEDRCVHCGACTAVCPSDALTMSPDDWSLQFNREKCVVCGLCTKACPLSVMSLE